MKKIVVVNAGPRKGWNMDALQLSDYDATAWPWSFFDPASKIERHETVFSQEKQTAFEKGAALAAE